MSDDVSLKTGDLVAASGHTGTFIVLECSTDGLSAEIQLFSHSKQQPIGLPRKAPTSTLIQLVWPTALDSKVEHLRQWLSEQSDTPVHVQWQSDDQCYRFYFGEREQDWRYILDVYKGDIDEQTAPAMIENLAARDWLGILRSSARKLVPYFMDKAFKSGEFRPWPGALSHKQRITNNV